MWETGNTYSFSRLDRSDSCYSVRFPYLIARCSIERMTLRKLYRLFLDFGGADVEENVVAELLNLLPFN
jgi:hypothetical protein